MKKAGKTIIVVDVPLYGKMQPTEIEVDVFYSKLVGFCYYRNNMWYSKSVTGRTFEDLEIEYRKMDYPKWSNIDLNEV